jgi:hypothetical protein
MAGLACHEAGQEIFSLLQKKQTNSRAHPIQRVAGSFSGIKRPERVVDRSHPSTAEFKNEWSYVSAPLLCHRRREGGTLLALLYGRLYWRTFVPRPLNRVYVKSKHILCHFNNYQLYKGYPSTCTMEFFIIISPLSPTCTGKIF